MRNLFNSSRALINPKDTSTSASSLEWPDVDLGTGVIRLRAEHSKNKQPRTLMLTGDLLEVMRRRAALRRLDCLLVFHKDGKPLGDFRKAWATACKAAGLAGQHFHDLRRSAIRNMVRGGTPERVAMAISGHKTRSTFDRYNIVSEADLALAAERTDAYVAKRREAAPRIVALASIQREHGQWGGQRGVCLGTRGCKCLNYQVRPG